MPVSQDDVFAETEGDAWWRRNRMGIERWDPGGDIPLQLIRLYGLKPHRVIEIGAANGYRVAEIKRRYECGLAVAVDVSTEAINDGTARFRGVTCTYGRADDTGIRGVFDLVICNFVLHWIGRDRLFKALAEVDRLTDGGGYVLLGDFFPSAPVEVPYHHQPGLVTYKRDYAAVLRASGLYQPIALLAGGHGTGVVPDAPDSERTGTWLLRKQPGG